MIVAVLAGVGLSEMNWPMGLSLSSLLTCMMTGAVFANMRKDSLQILDGTENWTPPLYMLFFVISGAELDLKVIPLIGIAGVAYIVSGLWANISEPLRARQWSRRTKTCAIIWD